MSVSVLFVCLGNICRSQLAEGAFRDKTNKLGLTDQFIIDSAGTGSWHIGNPPDLRGIEAAANRGIDISHQIARQFNVQDFEQFDYLLAMDHSNLSNMERLRPSGSNTELSLFLEFAGLGNSEVPDPYYGGADGFETCLNLIDAGCEEILKRLS